MLQRAKKEVVLEYCLPNTPRNKARRMSILSGFPGDWDSDVITVWALSEESDDRAIIRTSEFAKLVYGPQVYFGAFCPSDLIVVS